jgi:hexokinase
LENFLKTFISDVYLSPSKLNEIAVSFQKAMEVGLRGKKSSLKMIRSFISPPTGQELGTFLGLDFGGSNIRVFVVELKKGQHQVKLSKSVPLEDKNVPYNYKSELVDATQLFDFIAYQVNSVVTMEFMNNLPLGFTFSWPGHQKSRNRAELTGWTKEMKATGVEGQDVGELLEAAFTRLSINDKVQLKAIINDTVGTLLTGAYLDPNIDVGSILGTGHNTCYIEPMLTAGDRPMIVNTESGGFNEIECTYYDQRLDQASEKPGEQRLEKMVSSKYLAELLRIVLSDLVIEKLLFHGSMSEALLVPYSVVGEHLSIILEDSTPELAQIGEWISTTFALPHTLQERTSIKTVAAKLMFRSASLVAATFLGILLRIDPHLSRAHTIAVDGSMYEHMPGYAESLKAVLDQLLGNKNKQVSLKLVKGGSGVGACIAAATVTQD